MAPKTAPKNATPAEETVVTPAVNETPAVPSETQSPKKVTKAKASKADKAVKPEDNTQNEGGGEEGVEAPAAPTSSAPPTEKKGAKGKNAKTTDKNTAKKTDKKTDGDAPTKGKGKAAKGKGKAAAEEGTSDNATSGDEGATAPVQKKLSAVPMPLVKKLKEALGNEVSVKNMLELKTILETFIEVIVDTVSKGDSVTLPNMMTFRRVLRKTRSHMNPQVFNPKNKNPDMQQMKINKPAHYVFNMYVKARLKKDFEGIEVNEEDLQPKPKKTPAVKAEETTTDAPATEEVTAETTA